MQEYNKTNWVANETLVAADKLNKIEDQLELLTDNSIEFNEKLDNITSNKYKMTIGKNKLGVNIENPMSLSTLKNKFRLMKDIGLNTIVLCPRVDMQTGSSNELLEYNKFTYENVEEYTKECIKNGFNVVYKLHVECLDGTWRANINPSNHTEFFNNYKNFILKYGKLAEKYKLKIFCVGEEMMSITKNDFKTFWQDIFLNLKQVYTGKTTYGANLILWDDEHRRNCVFDLVDYLGIDLWAKQCEPYGDKKSNYNNLNGWIIPTFEELYNKYNKKIILTEIGYYPTPEGATTNSPNSQSWGKLNYNYHAQYFDMMFSNFIGQDWCEAIWYWSETESSYSNPGGNLQRFSVLVEDNIVTQKIFKKYKEE